MSPWLVSRLCHYQIDSAEETGLVTRLLHQIHFVSEQTPLNSTSYAVVALLLDQVVKQGGIEVESASSEEAQEQLTLVVNIIGACCGECQSPLCARVFACAGC
jgi:hypothetical protein